MSAEKPFGERKPYVPQYGNVNFNLICQEAGLDPKIYATSDFVARRGILELYELFSDGELIVPQLDTPVAAVGNVGPEIRHGEFYTKIASLWQRTQVQPGSDIDKEFNKLARFCGTSFALLVANGHTPLGIRSEVQITFDQKREPFIGYAGYQIKIGPEPHILDIGPGIEGRQFIDLQASLLKQRRIMQYLAISKGPFINQFLIDYGREIYNKDPELQGLFSELIRRGLFIGREDGARDTLEELISTPQPSGRYDFIDIAICNGVTTANRDEIIRALGLLPNTVRQGGYLLLGADAKRRREDGWCFDDGLEVVSDKFTAVHQVTKSSGSALLGRSTISTFAVLKKTAA